MIRSFTFYLQFVARMPAMTSRKLDFIRRPEFVGWRCSNCDWVFVSPDIQSRTLEGMIELFKSLRDENFASHACAARQTRRIAKAG